MEQCIETEAAAGDVFNGVDCSLKDQDVSKPEDGGENTFVLQDLVCVGKGGGDHPFSREYVYVGPACAPEGRACVSSESSDEVLYLTSVGSDQLSRNLNSKLPMLEAGEPTEEERRQMEAFWGMLEPAGPMTVPIDEEGEIIDEDKDQETPLEIFRRLEAEGVDKPVMTLDESITVAGDLSHFSMENVRDLCLQAVARLEERTEAGDRAGEWSQIVRPVEDCLRQAGFQFQRPIEDQGFFDADDSFDFYGVSNNEVSIDCHIEAGDPAMIACAPMMTSRDLETGEFVAGYDRNTRYSGACGFDPIPVDRLDDQEIQDVMNCDVPSGD